MVTYLLPFLGGLAGSLHCIGMCGGFPLALATPARRWSRQLLYNLGRVNTLAFIGALSGGAGSALVAAGPVRIAERALAVLAGTVMIVVGLEMLLRWPGLGRLGGRMAQATVGRLLAGVMRSRSAAAPVALGVFNAFLPCHLLYAFAAQAAETASIGAGMLTMAAFGLGTVPAMLALGTVPALLRPTVRARLTRAAAILVVVFGAITVARGLGIALPLVAGAPGHAACDGPHG